MTTLIIHVVGQFMELSKKPEILVEFYELPLPKF